MRPGRLCPHALAITAGAACLLAAVLAAGPAAAQTGPGGVGATGADAAVDLELWLRSDRGVLAPDGAGAADGDEVATWEDQSGNEYALTTDAASNSTKRRPRFRAGGVAGEPVLKFNTGSSDNTDLLRTTADGVLDVARGSNTFFVVAKSRKLVQKAYVTNFDGQRYLGYNFGQQDGRFTASANSQVSATGPSINRYNVYGSVFASGDAEADASANGFVDEVTPSAAKTQENFFEVGKNGSTERINVAEVIAYRTALNAAERRIVANYLGEKYGVSLGAHDHYGYGAGHPGDVAGIGRVAAATGASEGGVHGRSASSIVTVAEESDAHSLGDGEFVLLGHDREGASSFTTDERPNGRSTVRKLPREWRVQVTGTEAKTVDVRVDFSGLSLPDGYTDRALYVDDDGDFRAEAVYHDLDLASGSIYEASGVRLPDGARLAVAAVKRTVSFSTDGPDGREGAGDLTATAVLNFPHDQPVDISLTTTGDIDGSGSIDSDEARPDADGDATLENDYRLGTTVLTVPAGETEADLTVEVRDDDVTEQSESFRVTLQSESPAAVAGANDRILGTIFDDDNAKALAFTGPSVGDGRSKTNNRFNPDRQTEGAAGETTTLVFEVALPEGAPAESSPATQATVELGGGAATPGSDVAFVDGRDGTRSSAGRGTVTIPAGERYGQFEVEVAGDDTYETDETARLNVIDVQGGTIDGDDPSATTLTIEEDDPRPDVRFADTRFSAVESRDARLEIELSEAAAVPVEAAFSRQGGTAESGDLFFPEPATVSIPAGETDGTFRLPIVDDTDKEINETVVVRLTDATNADPATPFEATHSIIGNDNVGAEGPGGVGDARSMVSWLSAGRIQGADGDPVDPWPDASGNGNAATTIDRSSLTSSPATLVASEADANDRPVVDFGSGEFYQIDAPTADALPTSENALFGVAAYGGSGNKEAILDIKTSGGTTRRSLRYNDNSSFAAKNGGSTLSAGKSKAGIDDLTAFHLLSSEFDGGDLDLGASGSVVKKQSASTGPGTLTVIGNDRGTGRQLKGALAEFVAYRVGLNTAQRTIVRNYLAAKYGLSLDANDRYAGDRPANGNRDAGVIGIGKEGGGGIQRAHLRARGDALRLASTGLDDGDYLLAGHARGASGTNTSDLGGVDGLERRMERTWYVDVTAADLTATLTFAPEAAGFPVPADPAAGRYVLLHRDGQSGDWADVTPLEGASITRDGDISFSAVDVASQGDGSYTLGATAQGGSASSTALEIAGTDGNEGDADRGGLGGDAGWYMIGPPVTGAAAGDLVSPSDTDGSLVEFDLPQGAMLFEWNDDEGANPPGGWVPVSSPDAPLNNAQGHLLFLFDDQGSPDADPIDPSLTVDVSGGSVPGPTANAAVSGLNPDAEYHVLANPFNRPFDLTRLEQNGTGLGSASSFSSTVQVWDGGATTAEGNAQAGAYVDVSVNTSTGDGESMAPDGDVVSAWQGFVVQRTNLGSGAETLTFNAGGTTDGARSIVGSRDRPPRAQPVRLGLKLTVEGAGGAQVARDEAATAVFHPRASSGWDSHDASKLDPLSSQYAALGMVGRGRADSTGAPKVLKAVESRPMPSGTVRLPIALRSRGDVAGRATIATDGWAGVPEDWTVSLVDTRGTADTTDDRTARLVPGKAYSFDYEGGAETARKASSRRDSAARRPSSARSPGSRQPRSSARRTGPAGAAPQVRPLARRQSPRAAAAAQSSGAAAAADSTRGPEARFILRVEAPAEPLPVRLADIDARAEGESAAVLTWRTAAEDGNAGFDVQHQRLGADSTLAPDRWTTAGFVDGAGNTSKAQTYRHRVKGLDVGRHAFRLRQVDADGSTTVTDTVEARLRLSDPYSVEKPRPNPTRNRAHFDVTVRETQDVTAAVYDVLGRRVKVLHRGTLKAGQPMQMQLGAEGLASGLYLVRVKGDAFAATRRVTIVR
jgi:hypothetical protein